MRINYIIATWSGYRRNLSKDYLKIHLNKLFSLQHSLAQVTVVRPLGSDDPGYYDIDPFIKDKIVIIDRPANDRSYGQFIYAHQQFGHQFDASILMEDDYVPNIHNFDRELIRIMQEKNCDYLCGKYGSNHRNDEPHARHNCGIVTTKALDIITAENPVFLPNGTDDGQEQTIFSRLFTKNKLRIADYSDQYSVPYWDKWITYFSKEQTFNTLLVPIQVLMLDPESHFLLSFKVSAVYAGGELPKFLDGYHEKFVVRDIDDKILGYAGIIQALGELQLGYCLLSHEFEAQIIDRIWWMNRYKSMNAYLKDKEVADMLERFGWKIFDRDANIMHLHKNKN